MASNRTRLPAGGGPDRAQGRVRDLAAIDALPEVAICIERLDAAGVWWRRSTNEKEAATKTCRQAIKVRERLGSGSNGGIPLWAELKSYVGTAASDDGSTSIPFAAHTRANTQFDSAKLLGALGLDPDAASITALVYEGAKRGESLTATVGHEFTVDTEDDGWFGRVNPFNIDLIVSDMMGTAVNAADLIQLVDTSVDLPGGIPDTLMTNLGERTIALEIRAEDLVAAIASFSPMAQVVDIAGPDPIYMGQQGKDVKKPYWIQLPPAYGPKIGILTGNGADSGRMLWQSLLEAMRTVYAHMPDVLAPAVAIDSVPAMGLSMELVDREPEVRMVVLDGIRGLLDAGCEIVTIACNTTVYFRPEIEALCAERGATFISIVDACKPALTQAAEQAGTKEIGIVGIGPVVDLAKGRSGYAALDEWGFAPQPLQADDLAFEVKAGKLTRRFGTKFRDLMRELPNTTKVVLLALTEVSMVYAAHPDVLLQEEIKRTYVDPLKELGRALALEYCVQGYVEKSPVCQIDDREMVSDAIRCKLWPPLAAG